MFEVPTIQVFVPVHNEDKYLDATLNSIEHAANFYTNQGKQIKITVSNNSSRDGSMEIIGAFAKRNPNWEIRTSKELLSGDVHFNNLIQSCQTKYICIVGGHDLVSRSYFHELELCISRSNGAVLAFSREFVDESGDGKFARETDFSYKFASDESRRFWQSIFYLGNATCIQGLISTRHLQGVNAFKSQVSDLVWLHGILKYGTFAYSKETSYIRTNPIRPGDYLNPKIQKIKSNRTRMEVSLLEAWIPENFSIPIRKVASILIRLKFSTVLHKRVAFRIFRRLSQFSISPASGAKNFSNKLIPISKILSI
jgi:glycosyltransferase involved in cell wall biosynthesis